MANNQETSVMDAISLSGKIPGLSQTNTQGIQYALSEEDRQAIESLPYGSALLIAQSGPNLGARFLLSQDESIAGRHVETDIFLDDVTVSRRHALFYRKDNEFYVRDIGSLNGTYVNRERVDEHLLRFGDEVQIGKFRLTYYPSSK
ncbi:MAG: FHA domain-containing protein [Actinomycetaceae bacterium]|nr:FHA domain-containing protein [Actinomycetaceae bacterium]